LRTKAKGKNYFLSLDSGPNINRDERMTESQSQAGDVSCFTPYGIKAVTWPIAHASLVGLETQQQKLGPYRNGLFWGDLLHSSWYPHTLPPNKSSGPFHKISLFFVALVLEKVKKARPLQQVVTIEPRHVYYYPPPPTPPAFLPLKVSLQDDVNGDPYTRNSQNSKPGEKPKLPLRSNGMEWNECNILKQHEKYITFQKSQHNNMMYIEENKKLWLKIQK
jgi:hypothetical protein